MDIYQVVWARQIFILAEIPVLEQTQVLPDAAFRKQGNQLLFSLK